VGAVYWKNQTRSVSPPPSTTVDNNTDIYFPIGIGTEIALGESLLLDLYATINVTWTEEMTGYKVPNRADDLLANDAWWTFGLGLAYSSKSCSKDSDNDGITDCDERILRLNPNNPDTDSDGLDDGVELNKYNTDPKNDDSDGDNLKDGEEIITYSTLPLVMDTDKDGINDFQEVITYKSDPLNADTDNDILTDGEEVLKFMTDPNSSDTDGDKLNDYFELNTSKTNPLVVDTDSDGLDDGNEINKYKTDPNKSDTDGDKLSDGREVNELRTNPLLADTDGGGIDDYLELQLDKNPLDPNDDIASIDLEIAFNVNSAKLTNDAVNILIDVLPRAKKILATSNSVIEIQGHTDASGSTRSNQIISAKRAKAVYDWFIARGIDSSRLSYKGYGESQPKYSNKTEEGKAKNRRIELYLSNAE
jgi:outer membrane protein OmpA-like peptidoglycan-associated protein